MTTLCVFLHLIRLDSVFFSYESIYRHFFSEICVWGKGVHVVCGVVYHCKMCRSFVFKFLQYSLNQNPSVFVVVKLVD